MIFVITANIVLATFALTAVIAMILWAIRTAAPQLASPTAARGLRPRAWGERIARAGAASTSQRGAGFATSFREAGLRRW